MDRIDAIFAIVDDAKADKGYKTKAQATARACKVLGLDKEEQIRVFARLEYCDFDGVPYSGNADKGIILPWLKPEKKTTRSPK